MSIPLRMPNVPRLASASGMSRKAEQARPKMSKFRYLGPTLIVLHWHDVAGLSFIIEMQLDSTSFEMAQHSFDPPLDRRMVCAVARDEFLDNGPQRGGRKLRVRYVHWEATVRDPIQFVPSIETATDAIVSDVFHSPSTSKSLRTMRKRNGSVSQQWFASRTSTTRRRRRSLTTFPLSPLSN